VCLVALSLHSDCFDNQSKSKNTLEIKDQHIFLFGKSNQKSIFRYGILFLDMEVGNIKKGLKICLFACHLH